MKQISLDGGGGKPHPPKKQAWAEEYNWPSSKPAVQECSEDSTLTLEISKSMVEPLLQPCKQMKKVPYA